MRRVDPKRFEKITRKEFAAYERVRKSGVYNMITQSALATAAAGLDADVYISIIRNYEALMEKYPDIRKGKKHAN